MDLLLAVEACVASALAGDWKKFFVDFATVMAILAKFFAGGSVLFPQTAAFAPHSNKSIKELCQEITDLCAANKAALQAHAIIPSTGSIFVDQLIVLILSLLKQVLMQLGV